MTVLDTDYLVALLRGNTDAIIYTDKIKNPKTSIHFKKYGKMKD